MSKKILFCSLFILIFLILAKQDSNAKTWERHNTTVHADSILAAINRGDSIIIARCKIFGPLIKEGTSQRPDTIKSFIDISSSTFPDKVFFPQCHFMERIRFWDDTLGNEISFLGTTFGGGAYFVGVTFDATVVFWGASALLSNK